MRYSKGMSEFESRDNKIVVDHDYEMDVLSQEQVEVNGRLMIKSVWKKVDWRDNNVDLKVNDFALENLLAAGVTPKFVSLGDGNLDNIDRMGETIDYLDSVEVKE